MRSLPICLTYNQTPRKYRGIRQGAGGHEIRPAKLQEVPLWRAGWEMKTSFEWEDLLRSYILPCGFSHELECSGCHPLRQKHVSCRFFGHKKRRCLLQRLEIKDEKNFSYIVSLVGFVHIFSTFSCFVFIVASLEIVHIAIWCCSIHFVGNLSRSLVALTPRYELH